jgi:signal transduction histidine kinase
VGAVKGVWVTEDGTGGPHADGLDLEYRKRYTRFSAEEAGLLGEMRQEFTQHAPEFVKRFYEHLLAHEEMRPFLADPGLVRNLMEYQRVYLISLASGEYGDEYLENRLRIGRTHERIGIQPQWYLGAYSVYLDCLVPLVLRHFRHSPRKAMQACLALTKLINLDMQIVLDAYFETRQRHAVQRSEQLAVIGELSASIAHEVRNPLAGMKGAMEVLRKHLSADKGRVEMVDEVTAQIVRLENLVRDLLIFSRPHPLRRQPVPVRELVDRVQRLVQEEAGEAGIAIRRLHSGDNDQLWADPQQLEQVFLNLIQNAVQAMEDGGILTVATRGDGASVEILIEDTGRGIDAADMPRIFQPFFTTKHRGSGLGLAIVRKIIEAHGGSIRVESEKGHGTRAIVLLPCGEAH